MKKYIARVHGVNNHVYASRLFNDLTEAEKYVEKKVYEARGLCPNKQYSGIIFVAKEVYTPPVVPEHMWRSVHYDDFKGE